MGRGRRLRQGLCCGLIRRVNWHEVIDERSYEMDQVIAAELQREPSKLKAVVARIERFLSDPEYSAQSKDDLGEWLEIINTRGLTGVLAALSDRSEEGKRLRQNSPFAILMPQEERLRILRRYEALRPRARAASV